MTKLGNIPGPRARLGRFAETVKIFNDPIGYVGRRFERYGPIFRTPTTTLTTPPSRSYPGTICVYGPELIRELVSNHDGFHRSAISHRLYPADGLTDRTAPLRRIMTGLTHARSDAHRVQRSLILPAFRKSKVETYVPDIISETERLMDEWEIGETYDMSAEMRKLILRISARSLFGQADQAAGERVGMLIDAWVDFIMSEAHLVPIDVPGIPYRRWLNLSRQIEDATRRLITAKRDSGTGDDSLLSRLIQATDETGAGLTEDELVGHISLLLWGSKDAAAAAMMWTLFLQSLHPEVHADHLDELERVLGGSTPSIEDLARLDTTDCILKESLRLLPPFPLVNRVASPGGSLGGYEVPEGTEVIMSIYHTHRMADVYEDPDAFQPDRWRSIKPGTFEYLPFGRGQRLCPGSNLAWQELLIAISMLTQRFRV
ncbi:MAG: cytochrome P450, partial [Halobacteriales archaeon]|nr:cytochrome P450 [Halobacteriales archaeon]